MDILFSLSLITLWFYELQGEWHGCSFSLLLYIFNALFDGFCFLPRLASSLWWPKLFLLDHSPAAAVAAAAAVVMVVSSYQSTNKQIRRFQRYWFEWWWWWCIRERRRRGPSSLLPDSVIKLYSPFRFFFFFFFSEWSEEQSNDCFLRIAFDEWRGAGDRERERERERETRQDQLECQPPPSSSSVMMSRNSHGKRPCACMRVAWENSSSHYRPTRRPTSKEAKAKRVSCLERPNKKGQPTCNKCTATTPSNSLKCDERGNK